MSLSISATCSDMFEIGGCPFRLFPVCLFALQDCEDKAKNLYLAQ